MISTEKLVEVEMAIIKKPDKSFGEIIFVFMKAFRRNGRKTQSIALGIQNVYLLPGLVAGIFAKSAGKLSGAKVSTFKAIKLNVGTPKFTEPFERSTIIAI